jgi:hypothetical protein
LNELDKNFKKISKKFNETEKIGIVTIVASISKFIYGKKREIYLVLYFFAASSSGQNRQHIPCIGLFLRDPKLSEFTLQV